jgi:Tol biopolymer transport system component/predicted Ser/Thr protein kinase
MALSAGTLLGPYEIESVLGAGGMGEVYRGRDTRLDRTVAIKVLPSHVAADPSFRQRFEREARTISRLDHPHICALYDIGEHDGTHFLVMQYLDGETLESRLKKGALPLEQALQVSIQIADALDKAHRSGIVHRDLKPANVMLTKSGAKLLDFGLAKSAAPAVTTTGLSMLPTTPPGVTAQGTILGTFQYMAPEQIEGLETDARTDIFAFGAVLFEMLTGRAAFEGKTRASLLGAILKDVPPRVSTMQRMSPPALDRLVGTCLEKDPDDRYQSARDLLRDLKWMATTASEVEHAPSTPTATGGRPSRRLTLIGLATVGVLVTALVVTTGPAFRHLQEALPSGVQFTIDRPDNGAFAGVAPEIAVSPDGQHVAFVGVQQGRQMLWVRSLADTTPRVLASTEGAAYPFWSADSRQIGFFANGKLKKIQVAGGPSTIVADATSGRGATWGQANVIVFAPNVGALYKVTAGGGVPTLVTAVDPGRTELHRWPSFLPDGRHFLFMRTIAGSSTGGSRGSEIRIGSIDSPEIETVVVAESAAQYAAGHLFFCRDGSLVAQPFDVNARRVSADPFVVSDIVGFDTTLRYGAFSVSSTGTVVFSRGGARLGSSLEWVDRTRKTLSRVGDPGAYFNIALAPDGKAVAVSGSFGGGLGRDIWLIDIARSVPSRFTFDPNVEANPTWSPDGRRIAYSASGPTAGLHVRDVIGGADELWWAREGVGGASDWSPDGRFIIYWSVSEKTGGDLWLVPTTGAHTPTPLLNTPFNEQDAAFSPDGRWLAYTSDESGRDEVFVQPFPPNGVKYPISRSGAEQPRWRGDGKELFFVGLDGTMMAATISPGVRFEAGSVRPLFEARIAAIATRKQYAVSRDGQRFLINAVQQQSGLTPLTVVVNWPATIKR